MLWVYLNIRPWTEKPVDTGLFCLGNWAKVKWEEREVFIRAHRAANKVSEGVCYGKTHERQGLSASLSFGCFSGMWRNSFNIPSFTALLRSPGAGFSHWLIATLKKFCTPCLNNHLEWDNPAGIHIVQNARNRGATEPGGHISCHTGNKPTMSVVDSWPPGWQREQGDSYMTQKISKKLFCFICLEVISRSEGKHLCSGKGTAKVLLTPLGQPKRFSWLNLIINFQKLNV